MKSRQGFVSNSSSSSFVVLGKKCKLEDYIEGDEVFAAINRDSDPTDLIYITPENIDTLKGIEFEFMVFQVEAIISSDDTWTRGIMLHGTFEAYGSTFDYHTHWTPEELKERYEGYQY